MITLPLSAIEVTDAVRPGDGVTVERRVRLRARSMLKVCVIWTPIGRFEVQGWIEVKQTRAGRSACSGPASSTGKPRFSEYEASAVHRRPCCRRW